MRIFLFNTATQWLALSALAVFLCFLSGCQLWTAVQTENGESRIILSPKIIDLPAATQLKVRIQDLVEEEKQAVILNFGDIMLDRNVQKQIERNGSDYIFEKIAHNEWYLAAEAVSANLEGPFADKRRATSKSIAFRFDPVLIPMLKKYNFSLFTLANNHSLDMSRQGFEEGKTNLTNAGIDSYGIGYGVSDDSMIFKEIDGLKFAFIGVDDTLLPINLKKMLDLIAKAESEADFTVINAHWGAEYQELNSNSRQQNLAHQFIDAGADLIIGHHPHVIQEMEIYHDRPIFYSLGNFIFDQYFSVPTQQGLTVGSVFSVSEIGEKGITLYVYPLTAQNSQQSLMSTDQAKNFMNNFFDKSRLAGYNFADFNLKIDF